MMKLQVQLLTLDNQLQLPLEELILVSHTVEVLLDNNQMVKMQGWHFRLWTSSLHSSERTGDWLLLNKRQDMQREKKIYETREREREAERQSGRKSNVHTEPQWIIQLFFRLFFFSCKTWEAWLISCWVNIDGDREPFLFLCVCVCVCVRVCVQCCVASVLTALISILVQWIESQSNLNDSFSLTGCSEVSREETHTHKWPWQLTQRERERERETFYIEIKQSARERESGSGEWMWMSVELLIETKKTKSINALFANYYGQVELSMHFVQWEERVEEKREEKKARGREKEMRLARLIYLFTTYIRSSISKMHSEWERWILGSKRKQSDRKRAEKMRKRERKKPSKLETPVPLCLIDFLLSLWWWYKVCRRETEASSIKSTREG